MRCDKIGRRGGRCAESGAGIGAGAGVGLTCADGCERERREGARGERPKRERREGAREMAGAIAWRLLAIAVCVTGGVFLLTVVFVALS